MSYWMHEQTEKMKEIVLKFINNESLLEDEMITMRWYIHQFADAMPSKPNDLVKIFKMNQQELREYNRLLVDKWGIDAL